MEKSINQLEEGLLAKEICNYFNIDLQDAKDYSPLGLAYIGDGVFDLIIRTIIVEKGNAPVNKLHKKVSTLVKAQSQSAMIHLLIDQLTEEEMAVYKRGRNAKSYTSAKNASMTDYRHATGYEALIGYLYLQGNTGRIMELVKNGLELYENTLNER